MPGTPNSPAVEATFTMAPDPRSTITEPNAWQALNVPLRLTAIWRAQTSRVVVTAGAKSETPAKFSSASGDQLSALSRSTTSARASGSADVAGDGHDDGLARHTALARHLVQCLLLAVECHDDRVRAGGALHGDTAHARSRTGNHEDAARPLLVHALISLPAPFMP